MTLSSRAPGPLSALILAFFLVACDRGGQVPTKATPAPVAVTLETLQAGTFTRWLTVTGTVEPTRVAGLASPAEGPVMNCQVREGELVKAGQELARIGRQVSATALVTAAREEVRQREQELGRVQELVTHKSVSRDQLDSARAALERARAGLAQAEQATSDYSISAPWDGVVSRVRVSDGNYIAPRAPLIDLFDPSSLVLRLAVPEAEAFALAPGDRVRATFDAIPERRFDLVIIRAWPDLDRRLRTRQFEAQLPTGTEFAPGMFARVRAVLEEVPAALTVPAEALLGDAKSRFVFVYTPGEPTGRARRRPVETGFDQDGRVWVRGGLTPGEQVIVGGIERVRDEGPVRLEGIGQPPGGPAPSPHAAPPSPVAR
ncbi:MAG: efflux RND transporter periplasmic adaptor subunit [Chromatiaceae bacterium]|nr:efflux RND transporter periplasmic adaptor subunit [Chromatiaceae bacterium]